ncbi:hypothetical protein [Oceaniglobus ichthyenteri]|uniref:hypothetical protein n=1 Tax=Oceaniglobus ichthyenteri TaxID=2136177 RepID=UPI000F84D549|nr:hypothetical protein [Oceaniglobus ichthyenteri]
MELIWQSLAPGHPFAFLNSASQSVRKNFLARNKVLQAQIAASTGNNARFGFVPQGGAAHSGSRDEMKVHVSLLQRNTHARWRGDVNRIKAGFGNPVFHLRRPQKLAVTGFYTDCPISGRGGRCAGFHESCVAMSEGQMIVMICVCGTAMVLFDQNFFNRFSSKVSRLLNASQRLLNMI